MLCEFRTLIAAVVCLTGFSITAIALFQPLRLTDPQTKRVLSVLVLAAFAGLAVLALQLGDCR